MHQLKASSSVCPASGGSDALAPSSARRRLDRAPTAGVDADGRDAQLGRPARCSGACGRRSSARTALVGRHETLVGRKPHRSSPLRNARCLRPLGRRRASRSPSAGAGSRRRRSPWRRRASMHLLDRVLHGLEVPVRIGRDGHADARGRGPGGGCGSRRLGGQGGDGSKGGGGADLQGFAAGEGHGRRWYRSPMHFETLAVHAGSSPDPVTGAVMPGIHLSTTFERAPDGTFPFRLRVHARRQSEPAGARDGAGPAGRGRGRGRLRLRNGGHHGRPAGPLSGRSRHRAARRLLRDGQAAGGSLRALGPGGVLRRPHGPGRAAGRAAAEHAAGVDGDALQPEHRRHRPARGGGDRARRGSTRWPATTRGPRRSSSVPSSSASTS